MEEQIIINKTERPSSYEFGKAGNRFKIYYSDADDLENQLNELVAKGLVNKEDFMAKKDI
jgi:hypothetical protein